MSSGNFQMLAKTFSGLEEVLKDELLAIGASDVEPVLSGVKFSGTNETLYKANFCCRTALRVLKFIGEYKIYNSNDLYQSISKIDWSEYFDASNTFMINSTVNSEAFNNSMFVSLKTKDAIIDQFRAISRKRPTVNTENPDIIIHVHASSDTLSVMLDSSGESLHKRGYRVGQNEASMNEVLAAGILKLTGWDAKSDLYDPMCGSGTISVEAALMARNIPPGIFRKEFAFEKWRDFDSELFEEVYNDDYEVPFENKIYASDISSISVIVTEKNAKNAGVHKDIVFSTSDFASVIPENKSGLLIMNPPYGERMRDRQFEPLYTMIGDSLKVNFSGFKAWIISSSETGFKCIGLRPSENIKLFNGSIECSFRLFELYEGSKKSSRQEDYDRPKYDQNKRPRAAGNSYGDKKAPFRGDRRDNPRTNERTHGNITRSKSDFNKPENTSFKGNRRPSPQAPAHNRSADEMENRRKEFHEKRKKNIMESGNDSKKNSEN